MKFVATKKGMTTIFFHLSLLLLFLDPGSEIRDPGWVKIRIRNTEIFGHKNPGSALDQDSFWIRIRIDIQPKMLDPDPYQMNTDPKPL